MSMLHITISQSVRYHNQEGRHHGSRGSRRARKVEKTPKRNAPRSVAPLPREDEVEPSHKRVFCFQRGHTKPSPC